MRFTTFLLALVASASALSPAQWRGESIYEVMTDRFAKPDGSTTTCTDLGKYCGGTYKGLISRLDYIQNMGFTALWISPVVKNIEGASGDGTSYHGYWQTDMYSVNTNYGSAADLVDLSKALHKRGMHLMVDVVTNHMAQNAPRDQIGYSKFIPFSNASYFHPPTCSVDFFNGDSTNLEQCWQGRYVNLADLRTEDLTVQNMFNTWIAQLVRNYTIDGLRIDSAKHVDPGSISALQNAAGGMHVLAEVYNGAVDYVCPYQNYMSGMMNFPMFYRIREAFQTTNGNMTSLSEGVNAMKSACKDVTVLGSFIENHDVDRYPSIVAGQDNALIRNAIAFSMLQDGIPIVYQGQEQKFTGSFAEGGFDILRKPLWSSHYSRNSDLYKFIRTLNKIRSQAIKRDRRYLTYNAWPVYTDSKMVIMRKGFPGAQVISIFTNRGASSADAVMSLSATNSGFTKNQVVMDVVACKRYTADSRGNIGLTIVKGEPIILFPAKALVGSGLCGPSK